jgi:hypothetical protein
MHDGANDRIYHIAHRGQRYGPLSRVELSARTLTHDMLVWREGMPEWIPIADIEELRPYVKHAANTRTTVPPRSSGGRGLSGPPLPPPPVVGPTGPQSRSGAATTIGILNIVIASLTLLCWPVCIFLNLVSASDGSPLSDVLQRPEVRYGQAVALWVGMAIAVPMLIAGIGLVRRRNWGRTTAVVIAWCGLVLQAGYFVFMFFTAVLPLFEIAAELDDPATWGGAFGAFIGTVLGACGGVAYDVAVLFVMAKAAVKRSLS